jgi:hypothetical protein
LVSNSCGSANKLEKKLYLRQLWETGEDQLFYCRQRGISPEDAVTMIVNGFCKQVFRELPMELAVEAQKLLGVSLEGSVG